MSAADQSTALAWLCEKLPGLRAVAANRTLLERIVTEVREGRRDAEWARRRLSDWQATGGRKAPAEPRWPAGEDTYQSTIDGDYLCPYDRCGRTCSADAGGEKPLCHLSVPPAPMRLRGMWDARNPPG